MKKTIPSGHTRRVVQHGHPRPGRVGGGGITAPSHDFGKTGKRPHLKVGRTAPCEGGHSPVQSNDLVILSRLVAIQRSGGQPNPALKDSVRHVPRQADRLSQMPLSGLILAVAPRYLAHSVDRVRTTRPRAVTVHSENRGERQPGTVGIVRREAGLADPVPRLSDQATLAELIGELSRLF
jgi:hypothetical protein